MPKRSTMLPGVPTKPFSRPVSCVSLLKALTKGRWPGQGDWSYVPKHTRDLAADTPITVLTFMRDEVLETEEALQTFRDDVLAAAELRPFLNRRLLEDVIASLAHECAQAKSAADTALIKRHHETLLIRAADKYWKDDAFLSLYRWKTRSGAEIAGALESLG